jgi:hypothetical protein
VDTTFEMDATGYSAAEAEAATGLALAEAVITCRALEDVVDSLHGLVCDLARTVCDLQDRVETLERSDGV